VSKHRGTDEDFDNSDAEVTPELFDEGLSENDEDYTDELRQREEEIYESLLDPLPDEDDEEEEE
jgi:hypothetical protein